MKMLKNEFNYRSLFYKQRKRLMDAAIYDVYDGDTLIGHEAFIIKTQEAGQMRLGGKDIEIEEKEKYPSDDDFGKTALMLPPDKENLDEILRILQDLSINIDNRQNLSYHVKQKLNETEKTK